LHGAGGEEAEVVVAGRRADGDEAAHLRPAHQQLHADIGAEGIAGDPEAVRFGFTACRKSSAEAASEISPMPPS
jgi:hypothetical protein